MALLACASTYGHCSDRAVVRQAARRQRSTTAPWSSKSTTLQPTLVGCPCVCTRLRMHARHARFPFPQYVIALCYLLGVLLHGRFWQAYALLRSVSGYAASVRQP